MKKDEFSIRFPNASKCSTALNASNTELLSDAEKERRLRFPKSSLRPELERSVRTRSLGKKQKKERDTRCFLVRVTSFRRRMLDEDNLCEKYVVDCCRYAGILPSDKPGQTHIQVSQQKVSEESEERTLVEVFLLDEFQP